VALVLADYEFRGLRTKDHVEDRWEKNIKPLLGSAPAAKLGTEGVKRYIAQRKADGAENATINRELAIIRRGFSLGAQRDPPLVGAIPHFPRQEEDNARTGFLEHAQYLDLLEAMPEHLKCMLVVGYHCGNRAGELRKLEWSQVDLPGRQILLERYQTKGKKARVLPIYGEMMAWLTRQQEAHQRDYAGCPWVFHQDGRQISNHLPGWRAACKAAGMPKLLFHDLRRSAVRNMIRAGIPEKVAMAISGHKTPSVFARYNIVSRADLEIAAGKMEAYLGSQEPRKGPVAENKAAGGIQMAKRGGFSE